MCHTGGANIYHWKPERKCLLHEKANIFHWKPESGCLKHVKVNQYHGKVNQYHGKVNTYLKSTAKRYQTHVVVDITGITMEPYHARPNLAQKVLLLVDQGAKNNMTITQKRKVLQRISDIENDIAELKKARQEVASSGYASATVSSGGGSRSYTRADISKITEAISALTSEMKKLRALLAGGSSSIWTNVLVVYDM